MERLFSVTGKRVLLAAGIAMVALATTHPALAQGAQPAPPDPFKFSSNAPVLFLNYIKTDQATNFEEGWSAIRALIAKTDNADLKAFGETLTKLYKVDIAPVDLGGGVKAAIYYFQLDSPSTTFSYNPRTILYEYLKAGQDGSPVTRAEADAAFIGKLQTAYAQIAPWPIVKVSK